MTSFHCPVCDEFLGFIDAKLPLPKIAKEHYTCCHCSIVFDGIGRQIGMGGCPCFFVNILPRWLRSIHLIE